MNFSDINIIKKILAYFFPPKFRGQLRKDHPKQVDVVKESLEWHSRCHRDPYSHGKIAEPYDAACAQKLVKTAKEC
jgi:hypothetical protein